MPRRAAASLASITDTPPIPLRPRHDGWTAERQRGFLAALAESGSVTQAAADVGLSARSAYRLRARADAAVFGDAWDQALRVAAGRLTAVAYERAITGRVKQFWRDGELVATTREPSDRLLMFLVDRLYHRGYVGGRADQAEDAGAHGRGRLSTLCDHLADSDCAIEPIQSEDWNGAPLIPPPEAEQPDR